MTTPRHLSIKRNPRTTTSPEAAQPAAPLTAVGDPKVVAEGVPTAVGPDPQRRDGPYPIAWLHVVMPRDATSTATSKCACGRDRSAIGQRRVLALIDDHTAHRDLCPLRTHQEGRNVA
ncbi:hypothetical protein [Streptomyces sp. H27-D2]|uniref:hypothetical protein n=1 Tax=Streptomyces sp. H27-D2 TaxID=3046304 RepID=UPI002DBB2533|nr:hypothetical protein [Streptomyces sp. H27-D2]MEC4018861.1 hypothetical protein [Streptomyces sp. H27-D2]